MILKTGIGRAILTGSRAILPLSDKGTVADYYSDPAWHPSEFADGPGYFWSRIHGVKVIPTSSPSGEIKRLTICPHGSFLFLTRIRYPSDSRIAVAFSTLSTSNSSHACGAGIASGQESLPKQDCAA